MIKSKSGIIYNILHIVYDIVKHFQYSFFYLLFRGIPLKNKIVATSFDGEKYGDNPRYIIESIHELDSDIEIVWLKNPKSNYNVPSYVKCVECTDKHNIFVRLYHFYTAKVWISSHLYDRYLRKRKNQYVVETWHGGLGIKKIEGDVDKYKNNIFQTKKIKKTSSLADLFISNSDFLSNIYRRAFLYNGKIWKAGFPKNDVVVKKDDSLRKSIIESLDLDEDVNFIIYAPTYRGGFEDSKMIDFEPYTINVDLILKAFHERFGGEWVILVRWHPWMKRYVKKKNFLVQNGAYDASEYGDMPEIISVADGFISDYSSCLFDAALKKIPCFIFAKDYEEYFKDRGVYYTLQQLPFLYAYNNEMLYDNIVNYDVLQANEMFDKFALKNGLEEPGDSSYKIAKHLIRIIRRGKKECIQIN